MPTTSMYTLPQIVALLPTSSVKTLCKAIKAGELRAEKHGRSWLVTPGALTAYRTTREYVPAEKKRKPPRSSVPDIMAAYGA